MKKTLAAFAALALTAGAAAAQERHDRGERLDHPDRGGQHGGGAPQGGARYVGPQGGGAPQGGGQRGGAPQAPPHYFAPQGGGAPQGGQHFMGQGGVPPQYGVGQRGQQGFNDHRFDEHGGRDFGDHRSDERGGRDPNDHRFDRGFDRGDASRYVQIQPRQPQGYIDRRVDGRGDHGDRDRGFDHRGDRDHSFDHRGAAGWGRGDERWEHDRHEWHEGHNWSYRGRYFEAFYVRPYYWPSGYGYRTWYPHEYLPFVFLNATWFLNNYYYYDLPAPPYGYRWVRYGPDALLVNVYTGEVVDVVYGVFYW